MDTGILSLRLPEWLYSYFEVGWMRYEQGLDSFYSFEGERFNSFEEYVVGVIEKLIKADYERFKIKHREDLMSLPEAINQAIEKCREKESLKRGIE
jgi:hypothetical protein